MDITHRSTTKNIIMKERPDYIILTAAQRNVDYCERNRKEVNKINVNGPRNVALASKEVKAKLIYLSTDLVFNGSKKGFVEEDGTNPLNHYGTTKLLGEKEVSNILDDYAIARVSVLYDWNPFDHTTNFIAWIHDGLSKGKIMELFTDQFRNATYVKNACDALLNICMKDEKGIFHVAGRNCLNRHSIGLKVAEIFGFDKSLITTTTSDKSDWLAVRPKKCCLITDKMENKLGVKSMSIEEGLTSMKAELG